MTDSANQQPDTNQLRRNEEEPVPERARFPRRTLLIGLAGGGTLIGGGAAAFAIAQNIARAPLNPSSTVTQPGSLFYTYRGHADGVWAAAWSPDGKRIASSSDDTTVQVWSAS